MAGVKGGVRTPSGVVESQAATTTKIRDSCQACAMSKVKCPKERPTCSRCESRSIPCQYVFTRRPGRRRQAHGQPNDGKRAKSSSSFGTEHHPNQALQSCARADLLSPSITPCGNNDYLDISSQSLSIPATPQPELLLAREDSDEISGLGEFNMFSPLYNFAYNDNDMDVIMSTKASPFILPALDNGGILQAHNEIGSLLITAQGIDVDLQASDMSSSVCTISAPSKITTRTPDVQAMANARSEVTRLIQTTTCGCLTQTIDVLKTMSAKADSQPCLSASEPLEAPGTLAYNFCHSVITENKLYIEAVSKSLICRCCSGDSFLLAVLSMTILKILERYTAAARGQSSVSGTGNLETERQAGSTLGSTKGHSTVMSRTYDTSNNRARKVAQLVLGELHRVQRLVNQLSPKLRKSRGGSQDMALDPELWGYQDLTQGWNPGPAAPFSATTLRQMEDDVRTSLSALSSEIINGLKQT